MPMEKFWTVQTNRHVSCNGDKFGWIEDETGTRFLDWSNHNDWFTKEDAEKFVRAINYERKQRVKDQLCWQPTESQKKEENKNG